MPCVRVCVCVCVTAAEAHADENGMEEDGDAGSANGATPASASASTSGPLEAGPSPNGKGPASVSRPAQLTRKNSFGSTSMSMDVETSGTGSRRADDDDLLSLGATDAESGAVGSTVNDVEEDELDDLLNQ